MSKLPINTPMPLARRAARATQGTAAGVTEQTAVATGPEGLEEQVAVMAAAVKVLQAAVPVDREAVPTVVAVPGVVGAATAAMAAMAAMEDKAVAQAGPIKANGASQEISRHLFNGWSYLI